MEFRSTIAAVAACALVVPALSRADDRNIISRIDIGEDENGAWLNIEGTRAPSFTQFKMSEPIRVVIDLAGAVFAGPAAELPGDGAVIRNVRTAMFTSGNVSVARVTLELYRETPYDIRPTGNSLRIEVRGTDRGRVLASSTNGSARRAEVRARKAEARMRDAVRKLEKERTRSDRSRTSLDVKLNAAYIARVEAEKRERLALDSAQIASARARVAIDARAAAEAKLTAVKNNTDALTQKLGVAARERDDAARRADELSRLAAAARLKAENEAVAHTAAVRRADEARARAEVTGQKLREVEQAKARAEQARAAAEADAREQRSARAALAERLRRLESGRGVVMADVREGIRPGARYAYAQYETGDSYTGGGREGAGVRVSNRPKIMTLVGFEQKANISRVFIRTNEPARYSYTEVGDAIIVEIENTRAATLNDLNHLDTRFFDSAVAFIDPEEIEGVGTHIRIHIRLRTRVPFEFNTDGNQINIDFRRPGK